MIFSPFIDKNFWLSYDKWLMWLLQLSCAPFKQKSLHPTRYKCFSLFSCALIAFFFFFTQKMLIFDRGHLFNKFFIFTIFAFCLMSRTWLVCFLTFFFDDIFINSTYIATKYNFFWLIYYSCFYNLHQWLSTPKDFFLL